MIEPFVDHLVREVDGRKVLSYGLSSHGYDIRLSGESFWVSTDHPETIDPKHFSLNHFKPVGLQNSEDGSYFEIPPKQYGLGVAYEKLYIPRDVIVVCMNKSTYARIGLQENVSPGEVSWRGCLTLEFYNPMACPCRIYANEGVVQLLFHEGGDCEVSYADRGGKYQDQPQKVVFPRM